MNKVSLIGRITKDIELKNTISGTAVATFTLAVDRDYKNKDGSRDTDFINCVAYKRRAEIISKYVHKGDKLGVSGSINTRTYERKDGSKAYITEVIVDGFDFLESKKDKPTETEPTSFSNASADDFEEIAVPDDEDLPF